MQGFHDSDLAKDREKCRSTTGYAFIFSQAAFSWASRLQNCVALSFAKGEYLALSKGAREIILFQYLFNDLHWQHDDYILFFDS